MSTSGDRTYGQPRPRSTGIEGATVGTTRFGIVAVAFSALMTLTFGLIAGLVFAVTTAIAFTALVIEKDGRSGYERALLMVQWRRARRRGEHIYNSSAPSDGANGVTQR